VLEAGIESLESFPGSETSKILRAITEDSSLFYSLREAAWRVLLRTEMRDKGLESKKDKVFFLLTQIDPAGVFLEDWWTGKKPGDKIQSACLDAAIERLLSELGMDAADDIIEFMEGISPEDYPRRIAVARILSLILTRDIPKEKQKVSADQQKEILSEVTGVLENIPEEELPSKTIEQIFSQILYLAQILDDQDIWQRLKKIDEKTQWSGAWKGDTPSYSELGVILPAGSRFIAGFSQKIETPFGTVLQAYYFSDKPAEEIVSHFEKIVGRKAKREIHPRTEGQSEVRYIVPLGEIPDELKNFIESSVNIFSSKAGYKEVAFGETLHTGKTMFSIVKTVK
jgi:hypothetical protein